MLACLAWLCLAVCAVHDLQAAPVQPYLRVQKDGIIYYYFSQTQDTRAKQLLYHSRNSRITGARQSCQKIPPDRLDTVIQEASRHYHMPPALIKALIRVESNFNPQAVSPKGAQGLMQLMPETADSLGVTNPYDIHENIWAGTRYFWMLFHKFNQRLHLALAAYNAGPKRVEKCQQVPEIRETQDFVRNVCANFLEFEGEQPSHSVAQAERRKQ